MFSEQYRKLVMTIYVNDVNSNSWKREDFLLVIKASRNSTCQLKYTQHNNDSQ